MCSTPPLRELTKHSPQDQGDNDEEGLQTEGGSRVILRGSHFGMRLDSLQDSGPIRFVWSDGLSEVFLEAFGSPTANEMPRSSPCSAGIALMMLHGAVLTSKSILEIPKASFRSGHCTHLDLAALWDGHCKSRQK